MVQGEFYRRVNQRKAEVLVEGEMYEAYISNTVELEFMKKGSLCYLREAENPDRQTPFDLIAVYDQSKKVMVCIDSKEAMIASEAWIKTEMEKEFSCEIYTIPDYKQCYLWIGARDKKDMNITVYLFITSLIQNDTAYLPERPSAVLNRRIEHILDHRENSRIVIAACRPDAKVFSPDAEKDEQFAELMKKAVDLKIPVQCLRCFVDQDGVKIDDTIPLEVGGQKM